MRILIIALSNSVHTARWLSQLADTGREIHLLPSELRFAGSTYAENIHPEIDKVIFHAFIYGAPQRGNIFKGLRVYNEFLAILLRKIFKKIFPFFEIWYLMRSIRKIKPDIIHSLEIQHAGYLTLEVKKRFKIKFPPWIMTNWGSDIYLYGNLDEHEPKIREVLNSCDYYSCECNRDARLAEEFGFRGRILPIFPNAGGFDLEKAFKLRQGGPVSERRGIMLKGYQSWSGRSLFGLRALERSADLLKGYEIYIFSSTSEDVAIAAELLRKRTGLNIRIIPENSSHEEILRLHGQSRIYIGVAISDAISTSLLEAMAMGSFPIQSWTSCADEWVNDGETAFLVPPEDPDIIEAAIRRALTDDSLVNRAAEKNFEIAKERLDYLLLKEKTIDFYRQVFEETSSQQKAGI